MKLGTAPDNAWDPNERIDVVVGARTCALNGAIILARARRILARPEHPWPRCLLPASRTLILLAGLYIWMRSLKDPMCVVLDLEDERAVSVALLEVARDELSPWERRLQSLVLDEEVLGGHDLRRLGAPRPIVSGPVAVYLDDERALVVDESSAGSA